MRYGYQAGFIFTMLPGFVSVFFMHLTKVEAPEIDFEKADEASYSTIEEGTNSPKAGAETTDGKKSAITT